MSNSDKRWVNLSLYALDEAAEIAVFDGPSQIVARGLGRLETQLEPGIYKVRAAAGSETWERLVKLEAGRQGRHIEIPLLPFATPVPLPDTAQASDSHQRAALAECRRVHVNAGQGSAIFIFARRLAALAGASESRHPADGLTLHSLQGDLIADLALASAVAPADDALPWAACNVSVTPGIYRLRQQLPAVGSIEQTLVASPGWQTQFFAFQRSPSSSLADARADLSDAAILYLRAESFGQGRAAVPGWLLEEYRKSARLTELARQGLIDRRQVLSRDVTEMLWAKWGNPMLGILGGHLLLLNPAPKRDLLHTVVHNLRRLLGPDHPDVEALALALEPDGPPHAFTAPPMLRQSWTRIVAAVIDRRAEVPAGSLAGQSMEGLWGEGPWHLWRPQVEADSAQVKELAIDAGGPAADDAFKRTEREVVLQAQLRDMGYQIAEVASDQESAGRPLPEELTADEVRRLCYVLGILPDTLQELFDSSRSLAQLYQSIRDSKESSWERTVEMERLVRRARQSARGQTPTLVWWAASNLIAEDFPGNRVTALAMLQVQPSTQFLSFILAAIAHSRSAFEQYHALLAAEPLIPLLDSAQKREMAAVIELQRQPGGFIETDTDRWRLSEGILRALRTDTSGKSNGPTATRGGVVNTGRGVVFAGNGNVVITGKVGRDVTVGNSRPPSGNVDKTSFLRQLAALRRDIEALAPQALTQDDRADALDALAKASAQADRPQPPGERIVRALDNVLEILETVDAGLAAQVQRARRLAKQLFH